MQVRCATVDDPRRIAEIQVAAWWRAYRDILPEHILAALSIDTLASNWRQLIVDGTAQVHVAEDEGMMLGWVSFGHSRDVDTTRNTAEVYAIYLDPAMWRRGIGTQLWQSAASALAEQRFERVTVWMFAANVAARRFYEAMGCRQEDEASQWFERDGCRLPEVRYSSSLIEAPAVSL